MENHNKKNKVYENKVWVRELFTHREVVSTLQCPS